MKNQREIYEALLAGETLKYDDHAMEVSLDSEGYTINERGGYQCYGFDHPEGWNIYEKPKVLTKFYKYLYPNGELTEHFYTGDLKLRFRGRADEIVHKAVFTSTEGTMLLRTSLYIELEV